MSWIELLKTHNITHINLNYCDVMLIQFTSFRRVLDIATYCSDIDYLECRLLRTSFLHSRWSKMMTIVFARSRDRSMQISIRRYEMCHVFSLIVIILVDTLLLILLELYKNQSFYDSISLMIYLSWYFWLIIIRDLLLCNRMSSFEFYLLDIFEIFVLWLTSV